MVPRPGGRPHEGYVVPMDTGGWVLLKDVESRIGLSKNMVATMAFQSTKMRLQLAGLYDAQYNRWIDVFLANRQLQPSLRDRALDSENLPHRQQATMKDLRREHDGTRKLFSGVGFSVGRYL